jgi:hypothetical protein
MIFVFGSNLKGIHGAGAAAFAYSHRGAVWGQGEGLQGDSYAIPTCSEPGVPLELRSIKYYVDRFLERAAKYHHDLQLQVTAIGCGIAGYKPKDIAPLFMHAPDNVWLPASFYKAIYWEGYKQNAEDSRGLAGA